MAEFSEKRHIKCVIFPQSPSPSKVIKLLVITTPHGRLLLASLSHNFSYFFIPLMTHDNPIYHPLMWLRQ